MVVILAVLAVSAVGIFTFRGRTRADELLSRPDIIEQYREKLALQSSGPPKESPLVAQSKMFSLRIDPPAPEPVEREIQRADGPSEMMDIPVQKKVTQAVKFRLVATCKYEEYPEKSLALLDMPGEGQKWFRQGEQVGHAVIEEIRDGSVVYVTNETRQEVLMPTPSSQLPSPLLAGGAEAQMKHATEMIQQMVGGNVRDLGPVDEADKPNLESRAEPGGPAKSPDGLPTNLPRSRFAYRKDRVSSRSESNETNALEISPEEHVEMLDDSISQLQDMIKNSENADSPEEQQGAAMLNAVLQMLEQTKQEAQKQTPTAPAPAETEDQEAP